LSVGLPRARLHTAARPNKRQRKVFFELANVLIGARQATT
jgi:hypothetical protein